MTEFEEGVFICVGDWLTLEEWPLRRLMPESLDDLFFAPPRKDASGNVHLPLRLTKDISLNLPGLDFVSLTMSASGSTELELTIEPKPFKATLTSPLTLVVDAVVLRPLKAGTKEPDMDAKSFDISLGSVGVTIDDDGAFDIGIKEGIYIPPCTIGKTGILLEIGALQWITPTTPPERLPKNVPGGPGAFTGLFMDKVHVEIPQLPDAVEKLEMDDAFIGTGGFSGKVSRDGLELKWDGADGADGAKEKFTGPIAGELFGFKGGVSKVELEFMQNALVGCDITGDVFVPYLDKRVGVTLGLDGAGSLTATAGLPTSQPPENGVTSALGYLLHLELGDDPSFLTLDVDSLRFDAPAGGKPTLEISGRVDLDVDGLDLDPIDLKKLSISNDGGVAIEGGWIDLPSAKSASFHGFGLELTRIGFGSDGDRRWVGLNGGLKLAQDLPVGASVEGLRISWDPTVAPEKVADSVSVTLDGVGLELTVPGAFSFKGHVAFFDDEKRGKGFGGHVDLDLIALKVSVDADLVVARVDSYTYFYIYLGMDLPTGIPLLSTGVAIYGFQGLVATNLAPDRQPDESWYHGWYKRPPIGVTSFEKWRPERGSWAVGLGATIGTAPDSGFTMSAKAILIVVGPGPQVLFQGKGNLLEKRMSSTEHDKEGSFEALFVLDIPAKTFLANLAAVYDNVKELVTLQGSAELAFSWARPQPPGFWHVFLGEKSPIERRWRAELFGVFTANAWFQIWSKRLNLGGWVGFSGDWQVGPLHAWLHAFIDGDVDVNLDPHQFDGYLQLVGEGGLEVFGFGFEIATWARVEVKAPTPRYVGLAIHIAVSIDLWLFEFSYEGDLALSWGSKDGAPLPASPLVERVALEHMKVAGELEFAPPDVRPVVTFKRPVRDLAQVGLPSNPARPDPDRVPPKGFSYRLAHVIVTDVTKADAQKVVAAAGIATVSGSTMALAGSPVLHGATKGEVELSGTPGRSFPVTGGGNGSLALSGSPPGGTQTYRFVPRPTAAKIKITSVTPGPIGTIYSDFTTPSSLAEGELAGGLLATGTGTWTIVSNTSTTLTLRGPAEPGVGSATVTGPGLSPLSGSWLPVSDEVPPAQTSLMLGSKTPYVRFRHNDVTTLQAFDFYTGAAYGCGPGAQEVAFCVGFDGLPKGPLTRRFRTEYVTGYAFGPVSVVTDPNDLSRNVIRIGWSVRGLGGSAATSAGTVVFTFDPALGGPVIECSTTGGQGKVIARRNGTVVDTRSVPAWPGRVQLSGSVDEIEISGSNLVLGGICSTPAWANVLFENPAFRQDSIGRHAFGSIDVESEGRMVVEKRMLWVRSPASGRGRSDEPSDVVPPLTVHLPGPVTRANVRLGSNAKLVAYAGSTKIAEKTGATGEDVAFQPEGWIDRIVITGSPKVYLRRVAYDLGDLGVRRKHEAAWVPSIERSIDALYRDDPILPPGKYRLDVVAGWTDTGSGNDEANLASATWSTTSKQFEVVSPPGTDDRYAADGPLGDLSLYVARTLPESGGRAHYRAYDVRVVFNESYVSQMFLVAKKPIVLKVVDFNDPVRIDERNVWGRDPELDLSPLDQEWMKTLHGDGSKQCATIEPSKIPRDETVSSIGPLLRPSELHTATLEAAGKPLFRFEFVTSRFANFMEHMSTFEGRCRKVVTGAAETTRVDAARAAIDAAAATLTSAIAEWKTTRTAASQRGAARSAIDAHLSARVAVNVARTGLAKAKSQAYANIQAGYGADKVPGLLPLPEHVEVSQLPNALLVESPEPMHFERTTVAAFVSTAVPRRRRNITFPADEFGAPDRGSFHYSGNGWVSDQELHVVNGAVEPRTPAAQWTLAIDVPRALRVDLVVRVAHGGVGSIVAKSASGITKTFKLARPADGSPVRVSASVRTLPLKTITLTGNGLAVESLSIVERFEPVTPDGPVRLFAARLPTSATDDGHYVDLIGQDDVDVGGWTVRWTDAAIPAESTTYFEFDEAGSRIPHGRLGRIFGALSTGPRPPEVVTFFGRDAAPPSPAGAVFQLVDSSGRVRDELAVMGTVKYRPVSDVVVVPDADGSRALLVPWSSPVVGHWRVDFAFARDAGPGLEVLSAGGSTAPETASLYFTVEK